MDRFNPPFIDLDISLSELYKKEQTWSEQAEQAVQAEYAKEAAAKQTLQETAEDLAQEEDEGPDTTTPEADLELDVAQYSIDDLLNILNLDEPTEFQIKDTTSHLIARMKKQKKDKLVTFFGEVRDRLLEQFVVNDNLDKEAKKQSDRIEEIWKESSFVPEETTPSGAAFFDDNTHFPIKQISSVYVNKEKAQIISRRIVVVDSQFRTNILPFSSNSGAPSFNASFTFNLANPVNNALSLTLYSYQIPTTWYAFNNTYGNTFFQYNGVIIQIPEGNYTLAELVSKINAIAALDPATAGLTVTGPDPNSKKITFTNNNPFAVSAVAVFYVQGNTANLTGCGQKIATLFQTLGVNNTLGWALGFRPNPDPVTGDIYITIPTGSSYTAEVMPYVFGPKYFYLNVEDFSNQRLTSGTSNITHTKNLASLTVPDYYKTIHADCQLQSGALTKAQIFSINALTTDNNPVFAETYTNKINGPNYGSTLAVIPLQNATFLRQDNIPIIQFGQSLVLFQRKYVKPIRLERMRISLFDDLGNLVNLNDQDWSVSFIVEQLVGWKLTNPSEFKIDVVG